MRSRLHAPHGTASTPSAATETARIVVGLIWLAGASFNLLVTSRMTEPFGWLADGSWFAPWRWFFGEVAGENPTFWIALLVAGEAALGVLTLGRGRWARLGLTGGALFSLVLFSLGTSYTLVVGPFALLLAWLARHSFNRSALDLLRCGWTRGALALRHSR